MKRILLATFAAAMTVGVAQAQNAYVSGLAADKDPMQPYYGNTYTCYWPTLWECHHWWNADGTEIFFSMSWAPEGLVTLRMTDGKYEVFGANGQWCAHNAKTVMAAGTALSRSLRDENDPVDRPPDQAVTNNNKNGCSPIVDATPGDHWYKLHMNGILQDQREQYTLMPGHQ